MDLTYFNPHSQNEPDFLANFVARQNTLDFFLRQLRLDRPGEPSRHHLIVAPRGYGKTSLLRRIAIAVRTEPDLQRRFIALTFREEQHNVISLDVFWRNCLQSLLEAREDEGAPAEEIEQLDVAWDKFSPRQALKRSEQDGEPAWHEFQRRCERLKRRPLLLMDNLDALLAGLEPNHQWALRRTLQSDDGPMLLAAAPRYPDATSDPQAAFYDFFRVQTLDKLSDHEVMHCLRTLAERRRERGGAVLDLLEKDPGRIAALNALAGGNPRTLNVLYGVLESHMSVDVLSQLSAMLDTFTPWYQARTEELPMQGRAVFDALALNWDPMTAASLGEATGLETIAVSSQLSRLEKAGFVEAVALSRRARGRNGYQVAERFFNIWYLMRNGPRRRRHEIRFLTVFLRTCFSDAERRSMARAALGDEAFQPGYSLALASSLRAGRLRDQLLEHASHQSDRLELADEYGAVIEELRRAGRGKPDQGRVASPEETIRACDHVIETLGSSRDATARERVARALSDKIYALHTLKRQREVIDVAELLIRRFGRTTSQRVRHFVEFALLHKGNALGSLGEPKHAIEAFNRILERTDRPFTESRELFRTALVGKAGQLVQLKRFGEAIEICERVLEGSDAESAARFYETPRRAFIVKVLATFEMGRHKEVVELSDEVLERFAGEEASELLRQSIVMGLLGAGLRFSIEGNQQEAIGLFDTVIARFHPARPSMREYVANAFFYKGVSQSVLDHHLDAKRQYRLALDLKPEYVEASLFLGDLLLDYLGDPAGALAEFQSALKANPAHVKSSELAVRAAYADALHGGERVRVLDFIRVAKRAQLSPARQRLLDVLSALAKHPWNPAKIFELIDKAVQCGDDTLWSRHTRELQRVLCYIVSEGEGESLRSWMETAEYPLKYAPLYHAVVAALKGDDHLLRINPEVRQPADDIYRGIARLLELYPKKATP